MKRKAQVLEIDLASSYVIIETVETGDIYVQFVPYVWIVALKKNGAIKPRDSVQCYFPRRLPDQTKDKFLKFTKQAKFACMPPKKNDKQWELRQCKILKIGLTSIEEAIDSEKFYVDYFSTTEAEGGATGEAEAVEIQPTKSKRTKKAPVKVIESEEDSSESEAEFRTLTNFNSCFLMDEPLNITMEPVANNFVSNIENLEMFNLDVMLANNDEIMYDAAAEKQSATTANVDVLNDISLNEPDNFMEHQIAPVRFQIATSNEASDSRCCSLSSCKCYQKLCNKLEWLQKKFCNEFQSIRGEIVAIRQLILDFVQQKGDEQPVVVRDDEKEKVDLTDDEVDTFNATFKKDFPVSTSDALVEFNETTDEKFKKFVVFKLEKLQGEDETKTVRKILKSLCDVHCMSQYSWFGTKKKKCFSKLQSVVDMIVGIMEAKYPKYDANELLKAVVQQRTKSAAEKVDKLNHQSTAQSSQFTEQIQTTSSEESVPGAGSQLVVPVINDGDQNQNQCGE